MSLRALRFLSTFLYMTYHNLPIYFKKLYGLLTGFVTLQTVATQNLLHGVPYRELPPGS